MSRVPRPAGLRRISFPDMPIVLWRTLLAGLVAEGVLLANGSRLHLPGHRATLSADDDGARCGDCTR